MLINATRHQVALQNSNFCPVLPIFIKISMTMYFYTEETNMICSLMPLATRWHHDRFHITRRLPYIRRGLTQETKPECLFRHKKENIFLTNHCITYFCSFIYFFPLYYYNKSNMNKICTPLLKF